MQLADLALGHGDDPHAEKAQPLEQGGGVLLVAAQPVQALRQHHVDAAGAHELQHRLIAGPLRRGGARRPVGKALDHVQPRRPASSRQRRSWSSIEASRCWSEL